MTKVVIKTADALKAFNVLGTAKYSKLEDGDKVKVWHLFRKLKPMAEKFEDDSRDAAERMKPEGDFDDRLAKAQSYEQIVKRNDGDSEKLPMGAAEYGAFIEEWKRYNKLVNDAVKEFGEKEVEIEVELLTEDAFGKLMASNDWTMGQAAALEYFV